MRFRKNNRIRYSQDHIWGGVGLPARTDFKVRPCGKAFDLVACGYGCLERHTPECYGNGSLFAWGLTTQQRKRFKEATGEAKG